MSDKIKSLFNKSQNDLTVFIKISEFFNLSKKGDTTFIMIEKKVRNVDIEKLLEKLWDEKYEIAFHDTIHPTLSDPGAYFSYSTEKSTKKNIWSMTYGNHGWSGGIYHLNMITVAQQITNLIKNTSMNKIQITNVMFFSNYEIKDEKSSNIKDSEIFEMHNKN